MGAPLLILLGALGGSLRGVIDLYASTMSWQSARREFRLNPPQDTQDPPVFSAYFDPLADSISAVVHTILGGIAALLLGISGQITGAYAAVVVGISAPALLAQLGNLPPIGEAVAGSASQSPVGQAQAPDSTPVGSLLQRSAAPPSAPQSSPERSATGTE